MDKLKNNSIKTKWTLVVLFLLIGGIIFTGYFVLTGLTKNQEKYYIEQLTSKSKDINLYIRESYISSDYSNLRDFYILENDKLANNLKSIVNLPVELLDEYGQLISSKMNIVDLENKEILYTAINGNPIYEKNGSTIVYLAPIYDFEEQIGICQLQYNTEKEDDLYKDVKRMFIKIGFLSAALTSIIGTIYFSKIANIILDLKIYVENIGKGKYEIVEEIKTGDELESLSLGIMDLSNIIEDNILELETEQEKLKELIRKLQELEVKQKEFIGNITHEFKTPLTILKIQIDFMDLYKDDEEIIKNTKDIMDREIRRLNEMVENILYLSKIQRYEYEFKKEFVDTKEILSDICNRLNNRKNDDLDIEYNLVESRLYIDKESFIRIFVNLVDNAVKYNNNYKKIIVNSRVMDGLLIIEIKNTGNELGPEEFDKIFEPFYTVESSRNKKISGTGLGLPLVKNLVEKQNGEIYVSYKNSYNIFTVIFSINELGL